MHISFKSLFPLCMHSHIYAINTLFFFCSVDGDEINQCLPGSCVQKMKFPVMIAAFVASAVVVGIVLVLFFIFVLKRKKTSSHVEGTLPIQLIKLTNYYIYERGLCLNKVS